MELAWTGGQEPNPRKNTVPKAHLMNTLKVRLENNRFIVPDDLDESVREPLVREIGGMYRKTATPTSTTFDTDEPHDDWVACAAMACYADDRSLHFKPRFDNELYQPGPDLTDRFGGNIEPANLAMRRRLGTS